MLINGIPSNSIPANDRAVSFGDGLFTTFRIFHGEIQELDAHLTRLKNGCKALSIQHRDWQTLALELEQLAKSAEQPLAVGKAIITRGQGGRGYSPNGVDNPLRVLSHFPLPPHIQSWREQGVQLAQARFQLSIQPALAGHKTLNRLEQILGKQELIEQGAVEGIFCDTEGYLVECNAANLFWRKGEQLYTPDLTLCGVTGIMRQKIMTFCKQHHTTVQVVRELPATLETADELFICNGITGPVPVTGYQGQSFDSHFITRLLQKELDPLPFDRSL